MIDNYSSYTHSYNWSSVITEGNIIKISTEINETDCGSAKPKVIIKHATKHIENIYM